MDKELQTFLEAMETRIIGSVTTVEERITGCITTFEERLTGHVATFEERLTKRLNDQHESILDRLTALEGDFQNTKGFLIEDAIISGRRQASLDARVSRSERRL